MRLHFVHVTGTRIIDQGTDDISRGEKTSGVMKGVSVLNFIPLHLTAIERCSGLLDWVRE